MELKTIILILVLILLFGFGVLTIIGLMLKAVKEIWDEICNTSTNNS